MEFSFYLFTVLTVDIVDNTFDNHLFDVYVVAEQTDKTEILQKFLIIFRKFPERLTESAYFFRDLLIISRTRCSLN